MKWSYTKIYVDISIPRCVRETLHQFGPKTPIKPQNKPYTAPEGTYGADAHKMKPLNTSSSLPMERVKIVEHIIGEFLYYVRGVDNSCLVLLRIISTINDPAEQNEKDVHQFLDYMATTTNAVVIFHTSDMILRADTDALYLTGPEARSHAAGYFY